MGLCIERSLDGIRRDTCGGPRAPQESAPRALRPFGAGATSLRGAVPRGSATRQHGDSIGSVSQPNFARVAGRPNMPQFDNIISDPNQVAFPFRVSLYLALF